MADQDILLDEHDDHEVDPEGEDRGAERPTPLFKEASSTPFAAGNIRVGPPTHHARIHALANGAVFHHIGRRRHCLALRAGSLALRSSYFHHEAFRALQTRLETQVLGRDYTEPPKKPTQPSTLVTKAESVWRSWWQGNGPRDHPRGGAP